MKIYGLVGKKLDHSFSRDFFTQYFAEHAEDALYRNFEIEHISRINEIFQTQDLVGLNVTIPYKVSIIPYLTELSSEAAAIGAVNTIQVMGGKKIGHNTDAFGFAQSIKPFLTFQHERALILGTGGASKSVAYVLENLGIDVLYVSRNPKGENQFGYHEVNEHMLKACKLVVNTTPIGTFPALDESPEFPFEHLSPDHLVVDLIYNPSKTKFLRKAEETILNGQAMLEQQALKAWEIWNK
jgi:shikimate dehydrogenase